MQQALEAKVTCASPAGSPSHRPEQLERNHVRATALCREKAAEKLQSLLQHANTTEAVIRNALC